jgi:putative ABC transport system permease protein
MTLSDTFSLAFRNLRQAKLRTALTTLGVSIGIASLAGMVSLGIGLQDQVVGRFTQSGVFGTITVTTIPNLPGPFAQLGARGRGALRRGGAAPQSPTSAKLDDDALQQISRLENVRDVYPSLRVPLEVSIGDFSRVTTAVGIPMSSKDEGSFQTLSYGKFFTSDSEEACMVSLDVAKQINENPGGLIGQNLTLSYASSRPNSNESASPGSFQVQRVSLPCRLVGIVERDTGPLPPGGGALVAVSGVMIPIGIAKRIDAEIVTNAQSLLRDPSQEKTYATATVKVKPQFTQDVEDNIRKMGYAVFSVDDALRGAKNAFIILDIFLSLIGSIALAVSSLGIVNTMVMSILERTREIGIMKAIGAGNGDIRRIFLIEASAIGFLGGLVGIMLGWSVGRLINLGANIYIRSQGGTGGTLFSLPLWLIAGAIVFSIAVSLVAGSYPASRAAGLDPIQALRHD